MPDQVRHDGGLNAPTPFGIPAAKENPMAEARIYQRYRNGMQASRAATDEWVLEFESKAARRPDPLTGWSGGADTQNQVHIVFPTLEEAKAYAEREGVDVHIVPASTKTLKLQSYADNFVTGKITY
jgi:hypothetical protein